MTARTRITVLGATALVVSAAVGMLLLRDTPEPDGAASEPLAVEPVAAALPERTESPPEASTSVVPAPDAPASVQEEHVTGHGRIFGKMVLPAEAARGLPITISVHRVDIESMPVVYADDPPVKVQADAEGEYEITELPWGNYVVFGGAPGYTNNGSTQLSEDDTEARINLTLVPGGAITGRVLDEAGDPVAGARVFNAGWNMGGQIRFAPRDRSLASQSITDEAGVFRVEHLRLSLNGEPGYRLAVKAEGYATLLTDYLQADSDGVTLTLLPGAVVAGQVIHRDNGAPISDHDVVLNSEVAIEHNTARTDTDGFFFLSNVAPGAQNIELVDDELVITPETALVSVTADGGPEDLVLLAAPGGRISGRVYEKVSGDGIGGVTISCYGKDESLAPRETVSRSDGTYSFAGLGTGAYRVWVRKPDGYASDHRTENQEVAARIGEETSGIHFPLLRGLRITGQVLTTDNEPLEGVYVHAYDSKTGEGDGAQTTADGRFVLAGFAAGITVEMSSSKQGLALLRIEPNGRQFTLEDKDMGGIKFIFGTGGTISGTVVDTNGAPQPGVEMFASPQGPDRLNGASATSGSDGTITFGPLIAGEYKIRPRTNGRIVAFGDSGVVIKLSEGANLAGQRFVVPAKGALTITGRVTDRAGRPVGGAGVVWTGGDDIVARTDASGQYALTGLHERGYSLIVTAAGFTPSESVSAWAGDTNVNFVLDGTATVSGQVLNAQTGAPITDFNIRPRNVRSVAQPLSYSAVSVSRKVVDLEGRFDLTNVQHGTTVIEVTADGFGSVAAPIPAVSAGETRRDVVIRLQTAAELVVRTLDASGAPVSGAQVAVYSEAMPSAQLDYRNNRTADDGTFRISSLPAGKVIVSAEHESYPPARATATVAVGTETSIDLRFSNGGSVEGLIMLNGRPVADQHVSANTRSGPGKSTRSGADGRYRIDGLPPGSIRMNPFINGVDGAPSQGKVATVTVADGAVTQANFNFTFGTGTIEGTVYVRPGVPLAERGRLSININTYGPSGERNYLSTQTGDGGTFLIENVMPGQVSVRFNSDNFGQKRISFELKEGEHVRRDILLSRGATLNVQLTNPPAPENGWAYVWVMPGDVSVTTLSEETANDYADRLAGSAGFINGTARVDRLEAGRYTLLTVFRPRRERFGDDRDPYADAVWSVRMVDVTGEGDITVQVSV